MADVKIMLKAGSTFKSFKQRMNLNLNFFFLYNFFRLFLDQEFNINYFKYFLCTLKVNLLLNYLGLTGVRLDSLNLKRPLDDDLVNCIKVILKAQYGKWKVLPLSNSRNMRLPFFQVEVIKRGFQNVSSSNILFEQID